MLLRAKVALSTMVVFAFCILGCTTSPLPRGRPPRADLAERLAASTVALVDEGRAFCSGVWVSKHEVLTAAHCIDDMELGDVLSVEAHGVAASFPAGVAMIDNGHDLGLLFVKAPPAHRIADTAPVPMVGERAFAMGHPLGLKWFFSEGYVAKVGEMDADLEIFWIAATTPISPGNSGGGLFDRDGMLVGIASRTATRGQNVNFFVPVKMYFR